MLCPHCSKCLGCAGKIKIAREKKKAVRYLSHGAFCTERKADIKQINSQLCIESEIIISAIKEKKQDG